MLRLVQWFDYQARWNQETNRDFRDLDVAREKIEDKITEVKKDLKRKREDIEEGKEKQDKVDDIIAKLVAAVAVLEGTTADFIRSHSNTCHSCHKKGPPIYTPG